MSQFKGHGQKGFHLLWGKVSLFRSLQAFKGLDEAHPHLGKSTDSNVNPNPNYPHRNTQSHT